MSISTPSALDLTRRAFALAAWAALLGTISVGTLSASAAWAGDDDRDDERDDAEDREDDERDEAEDREDVTREDAEDNDAVSGEDDDRNGPSGRDNGSNAARPGRSGGAPRDIAVYYPDGWIERIVSGRYELMDDQSRLVIRRTATREDFSRMEALR
jgi:hypothetical protein